MDKIDERIKIAEEFIRVANYCHDARVALIRNNIQVETATVLRDLADNSIDKAIVKVTELGLSYHTPVFAHDLYFYIFDAQNEKELLSDAIKVNEVVT